MVVGVAEFPSSVRFGVLSSFIFACSATLLGVCWLKSARIRATTKRDELSLTKGSLISSPFLGEDGISGLISLFPLGAWTIARLDIETRHSAAKWSILSLKQPRLLLNDIQKLLKRRRVETHTKKVVVVPWFPLCGGGGGGGGGRSHQRELTLWSYPAIQYHQHPVRETPRTKTQTSPLQREQQKAKCLRLARRHSKQILHKLGCVNSHRGCNHSPA